ncbi:MAG: hypothetical protein KDA24_07385 [Deltaproteobacteria bacterium]|nr:hypothetical protein [Deltaproteobacteria bacterium]
MGAFIIASARLSASAPHNLEALRHRLVLETRGAMAARFPVIKLSCYDDLWQETVDQLIVWSDVVIMDARGFTPAKAGVPYELGVILAGFPLDRTVFLVDSSTDDQYLEDTMRAAWDALPGNAPVPSEEPVAHVYVAEALGRGFRHELPGLVACSPRSQRRRSADPPRRARGRRAPSPCWLRRRGSWGSARSPGRRPRPSTGASICRGCSWQAPRSSAGW